MLNKLREKNKILLNKYKDDAIKSNRYMLIEKLLTDDYCFSKIDIEMAFSILKDLEVKDDKIKQVYVELISIS